MEVLYISVLTSSSLMDKLFRESGKNPGFCVQKFSRLIVHGLMKNGLSIQTLSAIPVNREISHKLWWNLKTDEENGIKYNYIPFINYPILRHLFLFFYAFFFTLYWGSKDVKNRVIVCDVLFVSICIGSLLASKIIGLKSVGVMTDMPGLMVNQSNKSNKIRSIVVLMQKKYITLFSSYVFLTEQMNKVINQKHKPYIVMEGLVDESSRDVVTEKIHTKNDKKVILYAGELHERYGLKKMVEAFMSINMPNIQLSLYGDGPFVDELKSYCAKDSRIVYHGIVSNEKVVEAELLAVLLINPRPTHEEFTLYSFPSKNMEYMVSGTPVLTTKLPGMPSEYFPFVYLFEDETVEGFARTLKKIIELPSKELLLKGQTAKQFVLEKKNNRIQTERMINLMYGLLKED